MEGGRIVQLGTAEDLDARPATPFVARFIGRTNVLPARVLEIAGGGVVLEVNGRRLGVARAPASGLAAGQTVALAIRPETIGGADAGAAEPVHGADSVFAGHGVVVLWGVLRGGDEATTVVVLHLVRVDPALGAIAVEGIDPFTQRRTPAAPPGRLGAVHELRVPRAWFGAHPRTEIHLGRTPEELAARQPRLTIYFTGVPDTTPELVDDAALAAYFERALARARAR